MLKKIHLHFYITLFLVTFMAEVYFITDYNKDLISIIGAFIALCISTYLLIDMVRDQVNKRKTQNISELDGLENTSYKEILAQNYRLTLEAKRLLEKNETVQSNNMDRLITTIKLLEDKRNSSLEEVIVQQKKLIEQQHKIIQDQKMHLKILIQYNKRFSDDVVNNVVEKTNEIVESLSKAVESDSGR